MASLALAERDLFLGPGEVRFAQGGLMRMRTLLGSCVAVTLWHPGKHFGGMCHFMLPKRPHTTRRDRLDGRYGDDAIELLLFELRRCKTQPTDYQAKLFGGGRNFGEGRAGGINIAGRNIVAAEELLARHGFAVAARHVGSGGFRQLIFDLANGDVWIRHEMPPPQMPGDGFLPASRQPH